MTRSLKDKAIQIKGQDYILVKDRILFLAEQSDPYSIETHCDYMPEINSWVVKATLRWKDQVYNGLAQEVIGQGMVNKVAALENCETSAVGRACAMAGIGVLDSIASVDEMTKASNRPKLQEYDHVFGDIGFRSGTSKKTNKKYWNSVDISTGEVRKWFNTKKEYEEALMIARGQDVEPKTHKEVEAEIKANEYPLD